MDFTLTEVQATLQDLARKLAAEATSPDQAASAERAESRIDNRYWAAIGDTGLAGVTTPSSCGGLGLGVSEAAVVAEGLGRAPSLTPWREHVVATYILATIASIEVTKPLPRSV